MKKLNRLPRAPGFLVTGLGVALLGLGGGASGSVERHADGAGQHAIATVTALSGGACLYAGFRVLSFRKDDER